MKSTFYLTVLFILIAQASFAQNRFGVMPQININFKLGEAWKANSKLENRQILYQNPYDGVGGRAEFERTDLDLIITRNKGTLKGLGAGYMIRRYDMDGSYLHRLIQQYSFSRELNRINLAHRFRTDQSFQKNEATQFRLRYRLSLEKPLNGVKVDPKEFYLKFSNEYIGILKDQVGNMEIRAATSVGYNLTDDTQFETGFDYRAENLIESQTEHLLWLTLSFYHSF